MYTVYFIHFLKKLSLHNVCPQFFFTTTALVVDNVILSTFVCWTKKEKTNTVTNPFNEKKIILISHDNILLFLCTYTILNNEWCIIWKIWISVCHNTHTFHAVWLKINDRTYQHLISKISEQKSRTYSLVS